MLPGIERKLTTILAADAEGYSRLMEADEVQRLGALRAARSAFTKFIDSHHGRLVNTAGDGLISEFPSVIEAVQCALKYKKNLVVLADAPGGALRPVVCQTSTARRLGDGSDLTNHATGP